MTIPASQIPVFILAGGLGTRLSEETSAKPKPMVEIGDTPILLHIMRYYYGFGFNDFVICAGYKAGEIKKYFLDYAYLQNSLEIDHRAEAKPPRSFGPAPKQESWRVRVIDTGMSCMTGGRIARAFDEVHKAQKFETFAVTYGDGLSDVDLESEAQFHASHGKIGTVLGVRPLARFGELAVSSDGSVSEFSEKPQSKQGFINGGFFFFNQGFRNYLVDSDDCVLERSPLVSLASDHQMKMFRHEGFWHPMDTLRDKVILQEHWASGKAPWVRASLQT